MQFPKSTPTPWKIFWFPTSGKVLIAFIDAIVLYDCTLFIVDWFWANKPSVQRRGDVAQRHEYRALDFTAIRSDTRRSAGAHGYRTVELLSNET